MPTSLEVGIDFFHNREINPLKPYPYRVKICIDITYIPFIKKWGITK